MESPHKYAVNGMIFAFFGTSSVVTDCDRRRNLFKKGDGLSFL